MTRRQGIRTSSIIIPFEPQCHPADEGFVGNPEFSGTLTELPAIPACWCSILGFIKATLTGRFLRMMGWVMVCL
jgi:hypothetical protein